MKYLHDHIPSSCIHVVVIWCTCTVYVVKGHQCSVYTVYITYMYINAGASVSRELDGWCLRPALDLDSDEFRY